MTLGQKIAAARKALGKDWTQSRLIAELRKHGVDRKVSWLMSIETDRLQFLSVEYVRAFSKVLKKPVEYFKDDPATGPSDALKGAVDYLMAEVLALKQRVETLEKK